MLPNSQMATTAESQDQINKGGKQSLRGQEPNGEGSYKPCNNILIALSCYLY